MLQICLAAGGSWLSFCLIVGDVGLLFRLSSAHWWRDKYLGVAIVDLDLRACP
jgi:hypothetical protein